MINNQNINNNNIKIDNNILNITNEVLKISRNTLLVNLRFLDLAIGQFNNKSIAVTDTESYATDGKFLIYNPLHVIKSYKEEKENIPREYLHIILHCIFRHMFIGPSINRDYWNLACDIAIENTITELDISQISTLKSQKQQGFIEELKTHVKKLTAEIIYNYFIENKNIYTENEIARLSKLFFVDSHQFWYKNGGLSSTISNIQKSNSQSSESNNGNSKNNSRNNDGEQQENQNESNNQQKGQGQNNSNKNNTTGQNANDNNQLNITKQELENIWKNISERVQVDMETFNSQHGTESSSIIQNLREINREKYDYRAFLRKFATINEVMKINDDEFDYIFYTYGLSLYKKMPLIEPLEYKDEKRIKEFVIAIDTSGSVQGEVVQKFIQKTYNILKSTETFTSKVNIHIIQCDAALQEDKKITNQKEFDEYIKTMKLHGFGGTDFNPVFDYVYKLIKEKEFSNLKGLIYFTDGYGDFPKQKTPYTTAFVFLDDNYNNYEIPSWAIKLVLKTDEIMNDEN